jgi:hypothetical protein
LRLLRYLRQKTISVISVNSKTGVTSGSGTNRPKEKLTLAGAELAKGNNKNTALRSQRLCERKQAVKNRKASLMLAFCVSNTWLTSLHRNR